MHSEEQRLQAIRLQLGIKPALDAREAIRIWNQDLRQDKVRLTEISEYLAELMRQIFRFRLGLDATLSDQARILHEDLWSKFTERLNDGTESAAGQSLARVSRVLKHALVRKTPPASGAWHHPAGPRPPIPDRPVHPQAARPSPGPVAHPANLPAASHPGARPASPAPAPSPSPASRASAASPAVPPAAVTNNPPEAPAVSPPTSIWKVLDVPDDPDQHTESECRDLVAPAGVKVLGARVRGKKHKHEGTNCDDWFEFAAAGPWTLIAVSDGAGSKKFSRVGALASTCAAIESLREALKDHSIGHRQDRGGICRRDETTLVFADPDVERVQLALHEAMRAAHEAVRKAADQRAGDPRYSQLLPGGRKLDVLDLSATLLLAVHTTIQDEDQESSLVMTCQVGDGMTAALEPHRRLTLLGVADSGEFSGETEFLTSERNLERANLARKTFAFFEPLRALMVMTDGVADDYFPNNPELLRLCGDLMLNGILDVPEVGNDQVADALRGTGLPTVAAVEAADFQATTEPGRVPSPDQVLIGSIAAFAERLGLPLEDVLASPALLRAGRKARKWCQAGTPQDRLRLWLDSYYVRGSFDDRTLVILSREALP